MSIPSIEKASWATDLIPVIETSLFDGHEDASFAVGRIAIGNQIHPGMEEVHDGYMQLRGRAYAWHPYRPMIGRDLVDEDGRELDPSHDEHSVHFAVVENNVAGKGLQRVVGSMRIIMGNTPAEKYFPEVFADGSVSAPKSELSRYVLLHEDEHIKNALVRPQFREVVRFLKKNEGELVPTHFVIEPGLLRIFKAGGIPVSQIAPTKLIQEYGEKDQKNLLAALDVRVFAEQLGIDESGASDMSSAELTYYGGVHEGTLAQAA